jgi:hypothetical protein
MPFSGSAEQIAGDVATYRDLGVSHLSFDFRRPSLSETLDRMQWFREQVVPAAG